MRKAFLWMLLFMTALVFLDYRLDHRHDNDTYLQQLEHTLSCSDWVNYEDSEYGYTMRYPSCFRPIENSGEGGASFAYMEELPLNNIVYMVLETNTQVCQDSLNPYREMRKMAKEMDGICCRQSDTTFLMTTKIKSRDPKVTAWVMCAKYILHQKLWFVETLIYPEDFAPAVQRVVKEVNDWTPFGSVGRSDLVQR